MKLHPRVFLSFLLLMSIGACASAPGDSAYRRYDGPESLLDVSSEVVNLSIADTNGVVELANWIERDAPTRAELYCAAENPQCKDAKKAFELMGVPVSVLGGGGQTATLIYERILARDCNPQFIDNRPNPYNLPSPALGCAVSANMVQHVSNKQEFINPSLSDNPSAVGAVSAMQRANPPREVKNPDGYNLENSLINQAKTQ